MIALSWNNKLTINATCILWHIVRYVTACYCSWKLRQHVDQSNSEWSRNGPQHSTSPHSAFRQLLYFTGLYVYYLEALAIDRDIWRFVCVTLAAVADTKKWSSYDLTKPRNVEHIEHINWWETMNNQRQTFKIPAVNNHAIWFQKL